MGKVSVSLGHWPTVWLWASHCPHPVPQFPHQQNKNNDVSLLCKILLSSIDEKRAVEELVIIVAFQADSSNPLLYCKMYFCYEVFAIVMGKSTDCSLSSCGIHSTSFSIPWSYLCYICISTGKFWKFPENSNAESHITNEVTTYRVMAWSCWSQWQNSLSDFNKTGLGLHSSYFQHDRLSD